MEADPQSSAAAESAASGTAESPASAPAPAATGGPNSWEAAFAATESGASNRGTEPTPELASPAPSAASAPPDEDGASKPDGASAEPDGEKPPTGGESEKPSGQRDPQPGSRRSTAAELEATRAENERMREQFETWAKERDDQRAADQKRADDVARAKAEAEAAVEGLIGKPGEMAGLLRKLKAHHDPDSDVVFDAKDENRLVELTRGAELYQPLLERARREAQAEIGQSSEQKVQEAEAKATGLMRAWGDQFEAAVTLDLPGLDEQALRKAPDMAAIVRSAHAAGASSRDPEIADLQGQLTDAKTQAFASQPQMATGGVSGNGRTERGYDPSKSPASNLEDTWRDEPVAASSNGRR